MLASGVLREKVVLMQTSWFLGLPPKMIPSGRKPRFWVDAFEA